MRYKTHPKLLSILGIAAALLPGSPGFCKTAADTQGGFGWPPITVEMHPWTRWWWMGSAVDPASLDRELARYKAAGLGGVEITPIYGVKGWEDRDIPYLTPKWMEMLDHAIASASALGMKTDMTTGTGWCFGGPTVSSTDANCVVVAATQDVQPGASLTGTFSPLTTQAIMAFPANGKPVDLTNKIGPDGRVDWTADGGPWKVYAISQKPSGVVVKRAAPGGAGPMLNPFFPAAMVRYMDWFEKPFAEYKPKLDAMFQDSYEYNSQWAPDFFAQFEKLRGYKLQDELPALLGNENDDRAARVKSDYRETISDIMTLESMPIWIQWEHAHGYMARYQAHGDPGNLLDLYAIADIPETEMIYLSRSILMSKFASSAAHVTGKKYASSETCTWLSEHFTETLAEVKYMMDDMFLAGINHVFYHGTAYSPDEAPWPGWCFYASTEMNPRNSIWRDVPAVNTYITRCQSVLQSGRSDNDVLVYFPIFDRWNDAQGMVQQFDIRGRWFESSPMGTTAHRLWDRGYAFDYVSDMQLAGIKLSRSSDGPMAGARLWEPGDPLAPGQNGAINLGGSRYKAIVVPPTTVMPLETLKQLKALAAAGIPVIFDTKLPDDVAGLSDLDARRQAFKALLADIKSTPHLFVGDVETGLNAAGVNRESMTDHAGLHFVRRTAPDGQLYYFISNRGDQPVDGLITLAASRSHVNYLMDPMTGRTGLAESGPGQGNKAFRLQLDPGESMIVKTIGAFAGYLNKWQYRPAGTPVELAGTWKVKFIAGGPTLPPPYETGTLGSWTAQDGPEAQAFGGTAFYSLTFDAPPGARGPFMISLGKVCQSARVRLNGKDLGTVVIPPFSVEAGSLLPKGNVLEVEVTSVSANRVRDMDIRHVPWKNFDPPGLLNVHYKPFDASGWPITDCGLLGPVMLDPQIARN